MSLILDGTTGATLPVPLTVANGGTGSIYGPVLRSYLAGCGIANGTDATNDINFSAGVCTDSTNAVTITCAAMAGKQLDVGWAPGAAAGMRNSGVAIANTTYHLYAVAKADGTQDYYAHTSTTVATVITALQAESGGASYLYARRIGSILREAGSIVAFNQNGDHFLRVTPVSDVNANNPGTSSVTRTMSVPTGIVVDLIAQWALNANSGGVNNCVYIRPLVVTDAVPGSSAVPYGNIIQAGNDLGRYLWPSAQLVTRTNTSAQVGTRLSASSASETLYGMTIGWFDRRGRDE